MAINTENTFKRLRNRYRLVIMNDDTYEEVAVFKLNRLSVYVGLSIIFVLLVGLTIAILTFTDLKYLIPGYGKQSSMTELRKLKMRTDSLETVLTQKQHYLEGVQKVLRGDTKELRSDTTLLQLPADTGNPD